MSIICQEAVFKKRRGIQLITGKTANRTQVSALLQPIWI